MAISKWAKRRYKVKSIKKKKKKKSEEESWKLKF